MSNKYDEGWIGVDLDGTLAKYEGRIDIVGNPISIMMNRVKRWIGEGKKVKIFTARVSHAAEFNRNQRKIIRFWMKENGLPELEITCKKDFSMIELWDDRCIQVVTNEGTRVHY